VEAGLKSHLLLSVLRRPRLELFDRIIYRVEEMVSGARTMTHVLCCAVRFAAVRFAAVRCAALCKASLLCAVQGCTRGECSSHMQQPKKDSYALTSLRAPPCAATMPAALRLLVVCCQRH
jgi:hypothetical protein